MVYIETAVILALTLFNGILAMSELAIVSSRRSRLDTMAASGSRGARVALELIDDPSRFLSTVQIGITLVGIVAGALGGATLAIRLGDWLNGLAVIAPHGHALAMTVVVSAITYVSLLIGELVPKRMALANPERVAAGLAPAMSALARAALPLVWLLTASTEAVVRRIGLQKTRTAAVTEEEVRSLIAAGTQAGIFVPQEREMIEGVMRLADRSVDVIMTPRPDIVWLDQTDSIDKIAATIAEARHSRLLVCRETVDEPVGVVHARELLAPALRRQPIDLKALMVPVLMVPEGTPVLRVLDLFKRRRLHMAVVVDEFGMNQGIVTPVDVLESIAGELPEAGEELEFSIVQRPDGSWLVDGRVPVDEFEDRTGVRGLRDTGEYHTVAGFVLDRLGHLPKTGESFVFQGHTFEVVDMDGRRIDEVLVAAVLEADPAVE
jgi:putative hemolysin